MDVLFLGVYLFIGICIALYMYHDIDGEGGYSLYVFIICIWPAIVLFGIILWIIDFINHHIGGGPSLFV